MMGGGGAPGPRNYTDVEYYSPSYLFDGDAPAVRPEITSAPSRIGYDGDFQIAASGAVSRVTLVRNGSVTHGFNNDQNFQDLEFTQSGGSVTITAPVDGTYAPPGAYMLFVFDENGTPSVAKILDIDPTVAMDSRTPQVVDQFEYPRLPTDWRGGNPTAVVDVAAGNGRMTPWTVESPVQLVRGTVTGQGGLGLTGYHLGLGGSGSLERVLTGLDPGRDYRISLRYARDGRSAGTDAATTALSVGDLSTTLTAGTDLSSQNAFGTYVGTFTAGARQQTLSLSGTGTAGMMIDDLVVVGQDPGASDVPIRYEFEEGTGTTAANTGQSGDVGDAVLTGTTGWSDNGVLGKALDLPGRQQRQRGRPARQPAPGCGRLHHLVVGAPGREGELDQPVPHRRRPRRRRELLPDPDADPGGREHRSGCHLQEEGQPRPGAGLRHSGAGRGRQPVEPCRLHPSGHDRHALPQR